MDATHRVAAVTVLSLRQSQETHRDDDPEPMSWHPATLLIIAVCLTPICLNVQDILQFKNRPIIEFLNYCGKIHIT